MFRLVFTEKKKKKKKKMSSAAVVIGTLRVNKDNVYFFCLKQILKIQSTLVISNSKGLTETLRDIHTSSYQS